MSPLALVNFGIAERDVVLRGGEPPRGAARSGDVVGVVEVVVEVLAVHEERALRVVHPVVGNAVVVLRAQTQPGRPALLLVLAAGLGRLRAEEAEAESGPAEGGAAGAEERATGRAVVVGHDGVLLGLRVREHAPAPGCGYP
jgi:hypothetical protein